MHSKEILRKLGARRRALRMSYSVLAKRTGVSIPTLVRTLSGEKSQTSFASILAIAEGLGMGVRLEPKVKAQELLEKQAERKAEQIVAMVQGTSALEGQAVDSKTITRMKRRTVHELLAGSPRRLWDD
jgi:transcriptional regulator with XRE-family HTH domain